MYSRAILNRKDAYELNKFAFMLRTAQAMGLDEQAVMDFNADMYNKYQIFSRQAQVLC